MAATQEAPAETSGDSLRNSCGDTTVPLICERLKKMGYSVGRHIQLYGEQWEVVSDPFLHDGLIAVRARSIRNASERVVHLPTTLLQRVR